MSTLLPSIILLAAAASPNVTYQIVTDEFYQHNTYIYSGTITTDTPDSIIYLLDTEACETKERLAFYNIIDEVILFNNRLPRKNFFTLKKDYERCLLIVRKNTQRNNMYYNRDYDYWYPSYNHIQAAPKYRIKMRSQKKSRNIYRRNVIVGTMPRSKIIIKNNIRPKPKVIVAKTKYHKKHVKVKKYHKKHSKK